MTYQSAVAIASQILTVAPGTRSFRVRLPVSDKIFIVTYAKSFLSVSPHVDLRRRISEWKPPLVPKILLSPNFVWWHTCHYVIYCGLYREKWYKSLCRISCFTTRNLDCKSLILYLIPKMLQVIAVRECWMYTDGSSSSAKYRPQYTIDRVLNN